MKKTFSTKNLHRIKKNRKKGLRWWGEWGTCFKQYSITENYQNTCVGNSDSKRAVYFKSHYSSCMLTTHQTNAFAKNLILIPFACLS